LDERLPQLGEVETVRKLKEARKDPWDAKRADDYYY
jgi:hypothetical protein